MFLYPKEAFRELSNELMQKNKDGQDWLVTWAHEHVSIDYYSFSEVLVFVIKGNETSCKHLLGNEN